MINTAPINVHINVFEGPMDLLLHLIKKDNLDVTDVNVSEITKQNVGAAFIVTGTLILTPEAKQPFEIKANQIVVEGTSSPDYPLQKKRHSMEYLRTIAHLRPRANTFSAAGIPIAGIDYEDSDTVEENHVVRTEPAAGEKPWVLISTRSAWTRR